MTDYLGETCNQCKRRYLTIYQLPDSLWTKVTGNKNGEGLLCPDCCDRLARENGIILYWAATEDDFPRKQRINQ